MDRVTVEVGDSVLLVVDDSGQHTQLRMPRDLAARVGLALHPDGHREGRHPR